MPVSTSVSPAVSTSAATRVSPRASRGSAKPFIAVLIVVALVAILGYGYASPYVALNRLKQAADARDAQTVSEYVDYPALRESLKEQIAGLMTRRVHGSGNPFAALGAMIGIALVGPLVDAYATPAGVAALLNGMPPSGNPQQWPPDTAPSAAADATPGTAATGAASVPSEPSAPPHTHAGYRSLNEFVVTYQHGVGDARYRAILHREGWFTWKLAAVELGD